MGSIISSGGVTTVTGGKDDGTSSSGAPTTLTDTGKSWSTNAYAGRFVGIHTGTGVGQIRYINSNTATVLTVDYAWDTNPDNTSQYLVSYNFDDVAAAVGTCTKSGNSSYVVTEHFRVSDDSTQTFLADTEIEVVFQGKFNTIDKSFTQFGRLDEYGDTHSGCTVVCESTEFTFGFGSYDGSNAEVVTANFYNSRVSMSGGRIIYGTGSDSNVSFIDCLCDVAGWALYGSGSVLKNMIITGQTGASPSYALGIRIDLDTPPENITIQDSNYGLYLTAQGFPSTVKSLVLNNIKVSEFVFKYAQPPFVSGDIHWNLVDIVATDWSFDWEDCDDGYAHRKNTVSTTVKDESDTALVGARVYVENVNGVEDVNELTVSGGTIDDAELERGYYTEATGDTITLTTPHVVKVRDYGKIFFETTKNVSAPAIDGYKVYDNDYVVANEATAGAYTGISMNGSSKTITLSSTRTLQELYDYTQWWGIQSGNIQYDESITTTDGSTFTLKSDWTIENVDYLDFDGDRLAGGTIEKDNTGTWSPILGAITIDFTTAGTHAMGSADISGTIELVNSSGGAVTVELAGTVSYTNTGPNITVDAPVVLQGLTFTGLLATSQVYIFETGTQTVIDYVESSTTSFIWQETYSGDQTVDYTIINEGYYPIRVTGVLMEDSEQTVSVQQVADRAYQTSSGLAFGSTATVNTGTKIFTVTTDTTVQNWYSFMMESWRDESTLKNVAFPLLTNGPASFTLSDGWEWDGSSSTVHLSQDGFRYTDGGAVTATWSAIQLIGDTGGLDIRFQQEDGGTTQTSTDSDGVLQVYGDASHGNFDYTDHLVIKTQGDGYDQDESDVYATYGTLEDQFYIVALNPTANGLATGDPSVTGVTITDHGASPVTWNGEDFSITITDSATPHTGTEIMRWLRYNYELGGAFQSKDTFDWHDLVQTNGAKFKTVRGAIYGDTGANIKGVRVVKNDGTSVHPDFNLYTADNGNTYEPPLSITISNSNIIDDTKIMLVNVTQDTILEKTSVSGGGGFLTEYLVGAGEDIEEGDVITIYGTYGVGTSYKNNYTESAVASTSNITFIGVQTDWTYANDLSVDGSAQTEFSSDYPNVEVDVNASGNLFNVEDLIGWLIYIQTTDDGIENFFGAINSVDAANWVLNTSVVDLYLDNTNTATATQSDEVILMRDDQVYPQVVPTSGGGGIGMIQGGLVFVTEITTTGENVITGDIDDVPTKVTEGMTTQGYTTARAPKIDNLDVAVSSVEGATASEIADEVMTRDVATETQATTNKDEVIKKTKQFS